MMAGACCYFSSSFHLLVASRTQNALNIHFVRSFSSVSFERCSKLFLTCAGWSCCADSTRISRHLNRALILIPPRIHLCSSAAIASYSLFGAATLPSSYPSYATGASQKPFRWVQLWVYVYYVFSVVAARSVSAINLLYLDKCCGLVRDIEAI
jgi:hypothetical protein